MIRGGYGEHGRSCFLVEMKAGERLYMVDCGIMDTDPFPYPDVTPEELSRVDYLFLTHCHKDHSGAFDYFVEHGFSGTLVTTAMTCKLAGISYDKTEILEVAGETAAFLEVEARTSESGATPKHVSSSTKARTEFGKDRNIRQFGPLTVRYGRTGHCPGGLWFEITEGVECKGAVGEEIHHPEAGGEHRENGENTIFFSGDYQENTLVYACDPVRESRAKLALVDCAHRGTELDAKALRAQIVQVVAEKLECGKRVILPVPQYGRGLELLYLMRKEFPQYRVCVDQDFVTYARKMLSEPVWYYDDAYKALNVEEFDVMEIFGGRNGEADYDILLLADTHLKKQKNVDFVTHAIENGEAVLINGRVKKNGPVGKLLDAGKVERFLFPHHQSHGDLMRVVGENSFGGVLPFHNDEKEVLV